MIEFAKDGRGIFWINLKNLNFSGGGGRSPLPSRSAHDFNINHDPMSG